MSALKQRLDRLEQQEIQKRLDPWMPRIQKLARLSGEPLETVVQRCTEWLRLTPAPSTVADANGKVDIEPYVRQLAVCLGLDPDEAVAEAVRILQEEGIACDYKT